MSSSPPPPGPSQQQPRRSASSSTSSRIPPYSHTAPVFTEEAFKREQDSLTEEEWNAISADLVGGSASNNKRKRSDSNGEKGEVGDDEVDSDGEATSFF